MSAVISLELGVLGNIRYCGRHNRWEVAVALLLLENRKFGTTDADDVIRVALNYDRLDVAVAMTGVMRQTVPHRELTARWRALRGTRCSTKRRTFMTCCLCNQLRPARHMRAVQVVCMHAHVTWCRSIQIARHWVRSVVAEINNTVVSQHSCASLHGARSRPLPSRVRCAPPSHQSDPREHCVCRGHAPS